MIGKLATKHSPNPVLNGEQLQTLVTDITETKEVVIIGGNMLIAPRSSYVLEMVDVLEARTVELEANQFSTTTKLNGEAIF
jgi:hypothetical protein